jgi:3-hydroxyacyl-[acyl-carrier-protein] dehydratase
MYGLDYIQEEDATTWLLKAVPQRPPFRFIDDILELDDRHVLGSYRYREDEFFYTGHFPGCPVTPFVILIETMLQIGGIAFATFLNRIATGGQSMAAPILTDVEGVEFFSSVLPGERVLVRGEKIYFRNHHVKIGTTMFTAEGQEISHAVVSGFFGKEI